MANHIKIFLNKFLELKNKNTFLKKILINIIYNKINVSIQENQIEISGKSVFIKTTPLIKNELFIKKEKIIKEFNQKTNKNITSIN
ncbi:MAG: hypothetical protein AAB507_02360 [Patescibacteria group bacterium]